MRKSLVLIMMVVILISVLMGCNTVGTTQYNTQILTEADGGVFNYDTLTDMQENWTLTTGGTTSSVFSIVDNGDDAANYLKMNTSDAGYAQISQTVYLRTYSYYKITYTYSTSTMGVYDSDYSYEGLYVNFLENEDFNIESEKPTEERGSTTNGTATLYFQTGNIREVNIALNLGSSDHPVTCSSAIITSFTLERVTEAVADAGSTGSDLYYLYSQIYGDSTILNVGYIVLGSIGTLLLAYGAYIVLARYRGKNELDSKFSKMLDKVNESKFLGISMVLLIAFIIRALILIIETAIAGSDRITTVYTTYDLEVFINLGYWIAQYGTPYFLEYVSSAIFMPMEMFIYSIAGVFGLIPSGAGLSDEAIALTIVTVIKAIVIIFDIATVAVVYKAITQKHNKVTATIMASFFALLPVMFSLSSAWGAMESVATFFIVLAFYFILRKNIIGMSIAYFFAVISSTSAMIFLPFILMYVGVYIYNSVKAKDKNWIKSVSCIAGGFVLFFLITLPFTFNNVADGDVFYGFNQFYNVIKGSGIYSANAFNFQGLIGNNYASVTTASTVITIMFVVFILALLAIPYFKNRSRLDLLVLATSGMILYWTFCNGSTFTTMLAALPLLFIYTAIVQDKRLFATFSLYSAFTFINVSYIYLVSGYTSSGVTQLDYSTPITYIMGVLNIILVIAYIVFAYDTIITKQVSPCLVITVPLTSYYKSIAKNIQIFFKNTFTNIRVFFVGLADGIKNTLAENKSKNNEKEED